MRQPTSIVVLVATLVAAAPVNAVGATWNPREAKSQAVAQLERRADQVNAKLARTVIRGRADVAAHVQRMHLRAQRQQLHDLIERLEAGQRVDPAEIDRILGAEPR